MDFSALYAIISVISALLLAPLLFGVINRVKAYFGGRKGQRLLQPYYNLYKLLKKEPLYSRTTTIFFRLFPVFALSITLLVLFIVPLGSVSGIFPFALDFIFVSFSLALMRFMMITAALDTGSAFEGMGANRESLFSALTEPALLTGFLALAVSGGGFSLSDMSNLAWCRQSYSFPAEVFLLFSGALFIILLTENARIPVDDPNTHLELTMIHEGMILDHSGVDLAFIEYASMLKFWIFSQLFVSFFMPYRTGIVALDLILGIASVFAVAIVTGITESVMARLRLTRIPLLLIIACVLSLLAFISALLEGGGICRHYPRY
jgi:formate hydrogenlyase subunit 4